MFAVGNVFFLHRNISSLEIIFLFVNTRKPLLTPYIVSHHSNKRPPDVVGSDFIGVKFGDTG